VNPRHIPPLAALATLAVSAFLWLPLRVAQDDAAPQYEPLLPSAAQMPEPLDLPERIALFDVPGQPAREPVEFTQNPSVSKTRAASFRLCAFAGGEGLWVVSLQDEAGHYFTIRSGELLPATTLEFKGMKFHTTGSGAQEGAAVFFDRSSSSYVDVMTFANAPSTGNAPDRTTLPQ
jgi:hypothetical protein